MALSRNKHNWEKHHFSKPVDCAVCGKTIYGLGIQVYIYIYYIISLSLFLSLFLSLYKYYDIKISKLFILGVQMYFLQNGSPHKM